MILKASQRGDAADLSIHLQNSLDNESIEIAEIEQIGIIREGDRRIVFENVDRYRIVVIKAGMKKFQLEQILALPQRPFIPESDLSIVIVIEIRPAFWNGMTRIDKVFIR